MPSSIARSLRGLRQERFTLDVHWTPSVGTLAEDVRSGLSTTPKTLPPKYFYDERGSDLFDRICDTDEYYPTRTEHALLERVADFIVRVARPTDLVELGSGAARKTRSLLDAIERAGLRSRYVPFDVSESMLSVTARALLEEYPWLEIHGIVGDYDAHMGALPPGARRLILFLGSTIGNFDEHLSVEFLARIARRMGPDDHLLLGTDLVKDQGVLDAAYNDRQGLTAEFNKNVLRVVNRELGGCFDPEAFEHRAFFDPGTQRVEMHLVSKQAQTVRIGDLDLDVTFEAGESVMTEISRKFTKASTIAMLERAGLRMTHWYTARDDWFGLSLARRGPPSAG